MHRAHFIYLFYCGGTFELSPFLPVLSIAALYFVFCISVEKTPRAGPCSALIKLIPFSKKGCLAVLFLL